MFKLDGKLQFVTIDQSYLKALHDACGEVYFKTSSYESKPYLVFFICDNETEYVIPLSSAKPKHSNWKDIDSDRFLVYEIWGKNNLLPNHIYKTKNGEIKHVLSVIDLKKMIPVKAGVYRRVELNVQVNDDITAVKYKSLLNKEYSFCLKIIDKLIAKASKLYERQMATGKATKFCCDFKLLEKACHEFDV